ncbi:MAG: regulatory protein RecX [Lachnospiraceae bacterium]|nr:regulatory protein RecX [Lachnospiraceae bacterium]
MVVTEIKEYKKGRYEVYLNDEFAFILYKSELKAYGIKNGATLADDIIREINDVVLVKRCKKRAMNLLMKGDMTEMKLRSKLSDGRYSENVINQAIDYVKGYHYIDDRRYAMSFISWKASIDSKNTIRRKLIEKGVSKDIIDSCIEEYYVEDELNRNCERELIEKLIRKKYKEIDTLQYEEKQKLIASIMRKGFSYYDVEAVLTTISG